MEYRKKPQKPLSDEAARIRMADLCVRSEQCSFDIQTKLRNAGLSPAKAMEVIAFLKEKGFLDDSRYARALARDKVRFSAWGPMKIRNALYLKRIPAEIITASLEAVDDEEIRAAAMRAASAKAKSIDLSEREGRLKLMRHMASRGFAADMSREIVRGLAKKQVEEE